MLNENGEISVVVPCFNSARTVGETLGSAIGQRGIREIIAIDDGSSDETLEVLKRYKTRVDVLKGPNQGVSAARNRGIKAATGNWLLFLDSDDILVPRTVERRLEAARESNADVIICDWQEMIDDGFGTVAVGETRSVDWKVLAEDVELATASRIWAPPAAILYSRELVAEIGGFREDMAVIEDARFLFDAALHGGRFVRSDHLGAKYRRSPRSLSRSDPSRYFEYLLFHAKELEISWRARGRFDNSKRHVVAGIYNHAGRGLFTANHPRYLEAVEAHSSLGLPMPWHPRIASWIAKRVGQRNARRLLSLVGRG